MPPEQLDELEAAVKAMREAHAAGVLGPPPPSAPTSAVPGAPSASEPPAKPDTLPPV